MGALSCRFVGVLARQPGFVSRFIGRWRGLRDVLGGATGAVSARGVCQADGLRQRQPKRDADDWKPEDMLHIMGYREVMPTARRPRKE
jgi:hypothetical protein